jgi:hypothetical protein
MNFIPALGIHFRPIANSRTRWRRNLKGLSQDVGLVDFYKNILASLFNNGLSGMGGFAGMGG